MKLVGPLFPRLIRTERDLGIVGEALASRQLRRRGFWIWFSNWRCRAGELDLVAIHRKILVFVEIKTRVSPGAWPDGPCQAVGREKEVRLEQLARAFIDEHFKQIRYRRLRAARIDVIGISLMKSRSSSSWRVEYLAGDEWTLKRA